MRAVDTNILVRVFERDDSILTPLAERVILSGEIYVSTIVLCELAWVLQKAYNRKPDRLSVIMQALLDADQVTLDRDAVQAGLVFLRAGGDFSDGVLLHEATTAGCRTLATFDRKFSRLGAPDVTLVS